MKEIESVTCIKFEERSHNQHKELSSYIRLHRCWWRSKSHQHDCAHTSYKTVIKWLRIDYYLIWQENSIKDYIEFRHSSDCHSPAGRNGRRQYVGLSPKCAEKHTLIHEVSFQALKKPYFLYYEYNTKSILDRFVMYMYKRGYYF